MCCDVTRIRGNGEVSGICIPVVLTNHCDCTPAFLACSPDHPWSGEGWSQPCPGPKDLIKWWRWVEGDHTQNLVFAMVRDLCNIVSRVDVLSVILKKLVLVLSKLHQREHCWIFFFVKSLKMFEWLLAEMNALDLQLEWHNVTFQKAKIASQAEK